MKRFNDLDTARGVIYCAIGGAMVWGAAFAVIYWVVQ